MGSPTLEHIGHSARSHPIVEPLVQAVAGSAAKVSWRNTMIHVIFCVKIDIKWYKMGISTHFLDTAHNHNHVSQCQEVKAQESKSK